MKVGDKVTIAGTITAIHNDRVFVDTDKEPKVRLTVFEGNVDVVPPAPPTPIVEEEGSSVKKTAKSSKTTSSESDLEKEAKKGGL